MRTVEQQHAAYNGVRVSEVAKLLGDRPEVVLNTYSHLREENADEAIDLVGKIAGGGA